MTKQDTVKLLRECDAGIQMGISSIDEVLSHVKDGNLKNTLTDSKTKHEEIGSEVFTLLGDYGEGGKSPNPMAKSMSWVKTNVLLGVNESDKTVADLITDGCNMGVKSLGRYLNQYEAASEKAKDIARRLSSLEEHLAIDVRPYL